MIDHPRIYDRQLRRIFSDDPRHRRSMAASTFLRRNRANIRRVVSKWTGEYQLTLDAVFDDMIGRCRELNLRAVGSKNPGRRVRSQCLDDSCQQRADVNQCSGGRKESYSSRSRCPRSRLPWSGSGI